MTIDISLLDDGDVLNSKLDAAGLDVNSRGEANWRRDSLLDARADQNWAKALQSAIQLVNAAGGGTLRIPERPPDGGLEWPIFEGASPRVTRAT